MTHRERLHTTMYVKSSAFRAISQGAKALGRGARKAPIHAVPSSATRPAMRAPAQAFPNRRPATLDPQGLGRTMLNAGIYGAPLATVGGALWQNRNPGAQQPVTMNPGQ